MARALKQIDVVVANCQTSWAAQAAGRVIAPAWALGTACGTASEITGPLAALSDAFSLDGARPKEVFDGG